MRLFGAALALAFFSALPLIAAADTPAAPASKQEEPPGKVEGISISRPGGGFLGLQLKNNNFMLTFYDAKKHKVTPDVSLAALRWPVKYQPGPERTVLNPGYDASSLTSPKAIRPPHDFKLYIALLVEGSDKAVESYAIDFRD